MQRLSGILFCAILIAVSLSGCGGGGSDRTVLRSGTYFFPLLHNRELRYDEKIGSESKPFTMKMKYSGGNYVRVYAVEFQGIDQPWGEFICKDSLVYFSSPKAKTALVSLPEYRELWVKEPPLDGDSWDNEQLAEQTLFAGYEDVTVPAGKFEHCYKTVTTVQPAYGDSLRIWKDRGAINDEEYSQRAQYDGLVTVRWFAQGVGLVKAQIGNPDHLWELTAIVNPGTGLLKPVVATEDNQQ